MILTNYWKWLDGCLKYHAGVNNIVDVGVIDTNGHSTEILYGTTTTNATIYRRIGDTRTLNNVYPSFGTGDNVIRSSDYRLTNEITTSVINTNITITSSADDYMKKIIAISGLNNTDSRLEITEIGLYKVIFQNAATTSGSSGDPTNILLAIIKLDEPLIVEAHNSFTVTIEWDER